MIKVCDIDSIFKNAFQWKHYNNKNIIKLCNWLISVECFKKHLLEISGQCPKSTKYLETILAVTIGNPVNSQKRVTSFIRGSVFLNL